jgi:hypothetical protein
MSGLGIMEIYECLVWNALEYPANPLKVVGILNIRKIKNKSLMKKINSFGHIKYTINPDEIFFYQILF